MAKVKVEGFNELIRDLTSINVDRMTDEMIMAAEPILTENLKKFANQHRDTGAMVDSIKSTGIRYKGSAKYLVVRPTGKDGKGVRNMEKLAYLEYGTAYEPARPVLTPAVKASDSKIEKVWNEKLGLWMKKVTMTETIHLPKMKWE